MKALPTRPTSYQQTQAEIPELKRGTVIQQQQRRSHWRPAPFSVADGLLKEKHKLGPGVSLCADDSAPATQGDERNTQCPLVQVEESSHLILMLSTIYDHLMILGSL